MGEAAGRPVVVSARGGRGGGKTCLTKVGRSLLGTYLMAESESSHLGARLEDEIPCVVISVGGAGGGVILRSQDGKVTVTIEGGDLAKKVSVGEQIALVRR